MYYKSMNGCAVDGETTGYYYFKFQEVNKCTNIVVCLDLIIKDFFDVINFTKIQEIEILEIFKLC